MTLCLARHCFSFAHPGDRFCRACRLERDRLFGDGPPPTLIRVDESASRLSRAIQGEELAMARAELAS